MKKADFYLSRNEGGLKLKRTHAYYYQVQGQLAICEQEYCDFVCWTPQGMHIERIRRDQSFFDEIKPKLSAFFVKVILPLILTGRDVVDKENMQPAHSKEAFCYCQKGEFGNMVACDNPQCVIEWFHFSCVGLTSAPASNTWYCPDCTLKCRH